jgi:hypothetical protein
MKISQSFVKEYSKYKQKKACGLQVKAKYIDKIKFPEYREDRKFKNRKQKSKVYGF